ncbi:MAG: fasciclin domain-containing protein [Solirubrobacteraceae bacterium]|nr:fasciclin domain-containing protein [Solirubrobacteraceae bacterium]
MKLKALLVASVLAISAFALAACGSSNDETTSSATTTAPATASETIVAAAAATPDLSTLVSALKAADLVSTLEGKGPFTVFAPTNQAFSDIQPTVDKLLEPANKDELTKVLTYHVVPGTYTSADLKDGQKLKTVEGQDLTVSIKGGTVKVNDATVEKADIETSNGVVHIIDGVLVPPGN